MTSKRACKGEKTGYKEEVQRTKYFKKQTAAWADLQDFEDTLPE